MNVGIAGVREQPGVEWAAAALELPLTKFEAPVKT
jgi:hypothetical protein